MTQPARVEWVGDAVAVAVEVAMVVSICMACPEVGIRHGLDKVVVGTRRGDVAVSNRIVTQVTRIIISHTSLN